MVRSSQRGFTLIELVVVIVILGILAAFAVPKFMGLETRARIASLNAMAGTLRSGAAMAHGVYVAMGTNPASITVEAKPISMTGGYPNRTNLIDLIQDTSGFTYNAANGRFTPVGARTANCYVQYNNAPASGATAYTIVFPGGATTSTAAEVTLSAAC
jgi:MSHA pilin protein MshA